MSTTSQHDWLPDVQVRYAGLWVRVAAGLIDVVVYIVPISIIVLLLFGVEFGASDDPRKGTFDGISYQSLFEPASLALQVALAVVTILLWVNWDGRTPGKKILKLRIVSYPEYKELSYRQATIRSVVLILSALMFLVGHVVIVYMLLTSLDRRGWHDLIARTCVVHEDSLTNESSDDEPEAATA